MSDLQARRNRTAADMAVIGAQRHAALWRDARHWLDRSDGVRLDYWDRATGHRSVAHEIGHPQSARHDIAPPEHRTATVAAFR